MKNFISSGNEMMLLYAKSLSFWLIPCLSVNPFGNLSVIPLSVSATFLHPTSSGLFYYQVSLQLLTPFFANKFSYC